MPTADAGFLYVALAFAAIGAHLDLLAHKEKRTLQAGFQLLIFAGVGLKDLGDRAALAGIGRPIQVGPLKQAAAFRAATAMIVPKKEGAFLASGGDHDWIIAFGRASAPLEGRCAGQTRVM